MHNKANNQKTQLSRSLADQILIPSFNFNDHCFICGEACSLNPDPENPRRWKRVVQCRTADRRSNQKSFKEVIINACDLQTPMDVSNHLNYQIILFLIIYMVVGLQVSKAQDTEFWNNLARETLRKRKDVKINTNKAKNVILFLGDGMGVSSITAGRILKGQRQGMLGEEASLVFDEFPHIGLAKTYNTDKTVADSAGTATAFLCGVKSKYGTIGVDDNIIRYNCSTVNKSKLSCIGDWALMSGKGAGVVTNMRVTHATPSPLYAASAERYWEHDGLSDKNCDDIAKQLVQNYPGKNLQVILGGGRTNFFPNTMADFEYKNMTGNRLDGVNLVDKWKAMKTKENVTHAFVWNKEQFDKVDPKKIRNLFGNPALSLAIMPGQLIHLIAFILFTTGLFEPNHMKDITTMVNKDGTLKSERDPTLAEMTEKAIGVLQNNKNGFFLLVEGGLIDHFHHKNLAVRAISEVVEFDKAIEIALNITNSEETLIIVTADHSQSMQLNGYPKRGAPLFGQYL
ncbi:Alkaline phosphatase, tissue-nonspecific isozyme [Nymphon striatum]|nr:Alkaline phosphatase, tissue-nonspecific isozyme [Nymphon striatum]